MEKEEVPSTEQQSAAQEPNTEEESNKKPQESSAVEGGAESAKDESDKKTDGNEPVTTTENDVELAPSDAKTEESTKEKEKENEDNVPVDDTGNEASNENVPTKNAPKRRGRKPAEHKNNADDSDDLDDSDNEDLVEKLLKASEHLDQNVKNMYGQVAWCRLRGYPYWPGYVCNPTLLVHDEQTMRIFLPQIESHYWVYFYHSDNSAAVPHSQVAPWDDTSKPYRDGYPEKQGKKGKLITRKTGLKEAIEVAEQDLQMPVEKRVSWVFQKVKGLEISREAKPQPKAKRASDDEADPEAPPKKRRGRPPKNAATTAANATPVTNISAASAGVEGNTDLENKDSQAKPAPKKRGRPPKAKVQNEEAQEDGGEPVPSKPKGKPGRKPKAPKEAGSTEVVSASLKEPETKDTDSKLDEDIETKLEDNTDKGVSTEKVDKAVESKPNLEPEVKKRKVGRPPKIKDGKEAVKSEPKKRGRPPKNPGAPKIIKKTANDSKHDSDSMDDANAQKKNEDHEKDEATGGKSIKSPESKVSKSSDGGKSIRGDKSAKKSKKDDEKSSNKSKTSLDEKKKRKASSDDSLNGNSNEAKKAKQADEGSTKRTINLENMDLDKARRCAKKLGKCLKEDTKENCDWALQIMNALFDVKDLTLEMLRESGLPPVVNSLRQSGNPNVAKTASALRKHLMQQSGVEKTKPKLPKTATEVGASTESISVIAAEQPTANSSNESPTEAIEDKPKDLSPKHAENTVAELKKSQENESENVTTPEGDDSLSQFGKDREVVIQMIQNIISSPKVSREIEMALFDRFSDTTEEYKTQARRVIFGLRDHDLCRQKVLSGSLHVLELVFATDEAFTQYNAAPWKGK